MGTVLSGGPSHVLDCSTCCHAWPLTVHIAQSMCIVSRPCLARRPLWQRALETLNQAPHLAQRVAGLRVSRQLTHKGVVKLQVL